MAVWTMGHLVIFCDDTNLYRLFTDSIFVCYDWHKPNSTPYCTSYFNPSWAWWRQSSAFQTHLKAYLKWVMGLDVVANVPVLFALNQSGNHSLSVPLLHFHLSESSHISFRSSFNDLFLLFVSTAHTLHICLVNRAINAGLSTLSEAPELMWKCDTEPRGDMIKTPGTS